MNQILKLLFSIILFCCYLKSEGCSCGSYFPYFKDIYYSQANIVLAKVKYKTDTSIVYSIEKKILPNNSFLLPFDTLVTRVYKTGCDIILDSVNIGDSIITYIDVNSSKLVIAACEENTVFVENARVYNGQFTVDEFINYITTEITTPLLKPTIEKIYGEWVLESYYFQFGETPGTFDVYTNDSIYNQKVRNLILEKANTENLDSTIIRIKDISNKQLSLDTALQFTIYQKYVNGEKIWVLNYNFLKGIKTKDIFSVFVNDSILKFYLEGEYSHNVTFRRLNYNIVLSNYNENKDDYIVYPNPFENYIYIKSLDKMENYMLEIFDVSGKKIVETHNQNMWDLNFLSKGIYLLKITTNNRVQNLKINKL